MTSHDVHFEAKGNRWYFHAKLLDRQVPKNVSNRVDENQGDANDLIEGGKLRKNILQRLSAPSMGAEYMHTTRVFL